MKYCKNCNTVAEDPSKYCSACGGSDFSEEPISVSDAQPTENAQPFPQTPYSPDPSTVKKPKKSAGMIIAGVAIVVAAVVFSVAAFLLSSIIPYSKGETSDDVYTNEWANMEFELGYIWEELPLEKYAYSDEENGVECGLVAQTDDASLIVVFCEGWNDESAKSYLDEMDSDGWLYAPDIPTYAAQAVGDDVEVTIAGETYRARKYYAEWREKGDTYYHDRYECVRIQGDYAIHISVIVVDGDEQFYEVIENFKAIEEE